MSDKQQIANRRMFDKIEAGINKRIKAQTDSRHATNDEVTMCWLIAEIDELRKTIQSAGKCLSGVLQDPIGSYDIIEDTLKILKNHGKFCIVSVGFSLTCLWCVRSAPLRSLRSLRFCPGLFLFY